MMACGEGGAPLRLGCEKNVRSGWGFFSLDSSYLR
jgi:hypothetical protein